MDKRRATIKQRNYEQKGRVIITICDQTDKRVGSGDCERNCTLFRSIDHAKQIVYCYDPDKNLF